MSLRPVHPRALLALLWGLAAGSPPQPQPQPQLRGSGNLSASLQQSVTAAAPAHFVWGDGQKAYCLSSDGNRIGDGVKVQLWECDQKWRSQGQNFHLDAVGRIRMHQDPRYCLVIDGDKYRDGAQIQLWRCNEANDHQIWQFWLSGQIRSVYSSSPMCVAIDGNRAFNGAKIQVWSCAAEAAGGAQDWLQVSLAKGARVAYAVPNEDKACSGPFEPVSESVEACAAAAEAVRPGSGCRFFSDALVPWSQAVQRVDRPSWPRGCSFYGACQGGCGLDFNPTGTGPSCPTQGDCMSISVICQMALP